MASTPRSAATPRSVGIANSPRSVTSVNTPRSSTTAVHQGMDIEGGGVGSGATAAVDMSTVDSALSSFTGVDNKAPSSV